MDQVVEQPKLAKIDIPGYQEAWAMVSGQLQMEMLAGRFTTWIQPIKPLGFAEGVFRLAVKNTFASQWLTHYMGKRIQGLLEGIYNQPVTLRYVVEEAAGSAAEVVDVVHSPDRAGAPARSGRPSLSAESARASSPTLAGRSEKPALSAAPGTGAALVDKNGANGHKKAQPAADDLTEGNPRKIQLERVYGSERMKIIQPDRGLLISLYFLNNWQPLLGHSAVAVILAARSMGYWHVARDEKRDRIETDMSQLAQKASVSLRTVKEVLSNNLVKKYFLRYKVRRMMTQYGVRTAGIILQVRMDDPVTPEDQLKHNLPESDRWYGSEFEDETED